MICIIHVRTYACTWRMSALYAGHAQYAACAIHAEISLHSLKEHIRAKSWILCWGWYWPHSTTLNTIQSLGKCATQPENVKL